MRKIFWKTVLRSKISLWNKNISKYPLKKFLFIKVILCEDQAVKEAYVWWSWRALTSPNSCWRWISLLIGQRIRELNYYLRQLLREKRTGLSLVSFILYLRTTSSGIWRGAASAVPVEKDFGKTWLILKECFEAPEKLFNWGVAEETCLVKGCQCPF